MEHQHLSIPSLHTDEARDRDFVLTVFFHFVIFDEHNSGRHSMILTKTRTKISTKLFMDCNGESLVFSKIFLQVAKLSLTKHGRQFRFLP